MTVEQAALEYAAAGRVVFPVKGKDRPLVPYAALSPDVGQVRDWWRTWPEANIGLRTGNGLVVIDIDPRHGGRWDRSWPVTRTERTPSVGVHLFYTSPERVPNSVGRVGPGIDVRGHNGYVVVAPSPGYELILDVPIAPLPTLPEAARPRTEGTPPPGWQPFEPRDCVPKGERHAYLMRYGGWLWRYGDVTEDELEAALWAEAARALDDPPNPADYDEQRRMRSRVRWITRRTA